MVIREQQVIKGGRVNVGVGGGGLCMGMYVGGWSVLSVCLCVPTILHECMPSTSSPGHPVNVTYAEPRGKDQQMQQAQHAQAWAQYYAQQGWLSAAAPAQQPTVGYQARAAGVNPTTPQLDYWGAQQQWVQQLPSSLAVQAAATMPPTGGAIYAAPHQPTVCSAPPGPPTQRPPPRPPH